MNDFWKSYDITHAELGPDFRCYPLYGKIHLIELALSLVFIVGMALWYRRSSSSARRCEAFEKMIDVIADSRRISYANFDEKAFHGEAQMKCGKIG